MNCNRCSHRFKCLTEQENPETFDIGGNDMVINILNRGIESHLPSSSTRYFEGERLAHCFYCNVSSISMRAFILKALSLFGEGAIVEKLKEKIIWR